MNFEGCRAYEIGNGEKGILLLHGFTGTPKDMRYIAEHLAEKGFAVSVPLLPGHASDPEDLKKIGWEEWIKTAEVSWESLVKKCPQSGIAGLSMGALLALHIAAHWRNVKAVACLATPFVLDGWTRRILSAILPHLPWRNFYYTKKGGSDVRDEQAKAEFPSYTRIPFAGVLNFMALVDHVRTDLPKVTAPLLLVHSLNDHTAPVKNVKIVEKYISSPSVKKVILKDSYHVLTIDVNREIVTQEIGDFFRHHIGRAHNA